MRLSWTDATQHGYYCNKRRNKYLCVPSVNTTCQLFRHTLRFRIKFFMNLLLHQHILEFVLSFHGSISPSNSRPFPCWHFPIVSFAVSFMRSVPPIVRTVSLQPNTLLLGFFPRLILSSLLPKMKMIIRPWENICTTYSREGPGLTSGIRPYSAAYLKCMLAYHSVMLTFPTKYEEVMKQIIIERSFFICPSVWRTAAGTPRRLRFSPNRWLWK